MVAHEALSATYLYSSFTLIHALYNRDIRAREVIFVPHQLHSRKTALMAQNKTIAVALLLATLVAVMGKEPETLEETLRAGCKEECSEQKKKAPIDEKQREDFCFIKTKSIFEAHKGVKDLKADRFIDFCNNECNAVYKEDPATSKKCAESCEADAKEAEVFLDKVVAYMQTTKQA